MTSQLPRLRVAWLVMPPDLETRSRTLYNYYMYHMPQKLSGRESAFSARGPGFNPEPGVHFIQRLSSAAIAAIIICCVYSTCKSRAA